MEPLQQYIAEEIATDHADGILDRREAMRRLGMLGLGAAAASALLAACSPNGGSGQANTSSAAAPSSSAPASGPPGSAGALPPVRWARPAGDGTMGKRR